MGDSHNDQPVLDMRDPWILEGTEAALPWMRSPIPDFSRPPFGSAPEQASNDADTEVQETDTVRAHVSPGSALGDGDSDWDMKEESESDEPTDQGKRQEAGTAKGKGSIKLEKGASPCPDTEDEYSDWGMDTDSEGGECIDGEYDLASSDDEYIDKPRPDRSAPSCAPHELKHKKTPRTRRSSGLADSTISKDGSRAVSVSQRGGGHKTLLNNHERRYRALLDVLIDRGIRRTRAIHNDLIPIAYLRELVKRVASATDENRYRGHVIHRTLARDESETPQYSLLDKTSVPRDFRRTLSFHGTHRKAYVYTRSTGETSSSRESRESRRYASEGKPPPLTHKEKRNRHLRKVVEAFKILEARGIRCTSMESRVTVKLQLGFLENLIDQTRPGSNEAGGGSWSGFVIDDQAKKKDPPKAVLLDWSRDAPSRRPTYSLLAAPWVRSILEACSKRTGVAGT